MRKPDATFIAALTTPALMFLFAPAMAQAGDAQDHGAHHYVQRWSSALPSAPVSRSRAGHRHRSPSVVRRDRVREPMDWRAQQSPPRAYWIDRSIRQRLTSPNETSMDGFGCQYNLITATDDRCLPR